MNRLGRNWLSEVKLDWTILFHRCKENLNNISKPNDITEKLENLVKNCSEIFVSELGTIKGIKTRVNIGTNSLPKFMKARGAPFTMLEAVEAEINRMEKKNSILKSVPYSGWTSLIVIFPKPDRTIRLQSYSESSY